MSKINVLFPVETTNRELDFRLFLASLFAKPGNRIFVGQHDVIFGLARQMHGGLYVGKHLFRQLPEFGDYARYRALKRNRFTIIHLDEEGGVYDGDEEKWRWWLLKMQFDPRCLEADDYVCTWGTFQRDFYRSLDPKCARNIIATGHPRFDLYKPAYRAFFDDDKRRIQERFQEFILVNTNLGYVNNCLGLEDSFSSRVGYDPAKPDKRLNCVERYAAEGTMLLSFVKLIHRLSVEFPGVNIVLRPHPSENIAYYRTVFRGVPNVHVVREGPVGAWLLACKLLIHDGCTTGIEAFLADTSIINYKSALHTKYELFLPNIFGVKCFTEEEVMLKVNAMLKAEKGVPPQAEFTDDAYALMANFRSDSFKLLLEAMNQAESGQADVPQLCHTARVRTEEVVRTMTAAAKSLVRPFFPARHRRYQALGSHFGRFDRGTIRRKLSIIEKIVGRRVTPVFYSNALFSLELEP